MNKAPPAPASWHINVCDWSQKSGAGDHLWISVNFILVLILDPSATFCFLLQNPFKTLLSFVSAFWIIFLLLGPSLNPSWDVFSPLPLIYYGFARIIALVRYSADSSCIRGDKEMMSVCKKGERIVSRKEERGLIRIKSHNEKSTPKRVRMKDLSFSEVVRRQSGTWRLCIPTSIRKLSLPCDHGLSHYFMPSNLHAFFMHNHIR